MESTTVLSILLSDPAFVVIATIMIGAFAFGMRTVNHWLFRNRFMVFLGAVLMAQAALYFYSILPYTTVDDQLASLLNSWLASALAG